MDDGYYTTARREILPHLNGNTCRMLDIGCGAGDTTAMVRLCRDVQWAGGVETLPEIAERARVHFDRVWAEDAATARLEDEIAPGSLDLVLCLDVLEHMADPWGMVQRLSALIAPGGRLIVSVPNVRNYRFIWRLLVKGDFHYRDQGLLDRTHLRFFVKDTAVQLSTIGGLKLVSVTPTNVLPWHEPRAMLNALAFGKLEDLLAKQWLVVAEKG